MGDDADSLLFGDKAVKIALTWIDTPYQHQASVRGAGCDCLGLIRGIWRELYGTEPLKLPPYSANWSEPAGRVRGSEPILRECARLMSPVSLSGRRAGDVLVFRMSPGVMAKHMAIQSDHGRLIHAYWGRAVTQSAFIPFWRRRLVAAFRFPEPELCQTSS